MSQTLTQLIANLQALLLGDSTTFTTATCTAAIRQAFLQLNMTIPAHAAETQEAVAEQYEYELEDLTAMQVVDVLLEGTDTYQEYGTSLVFSAFFEDDRPSFRLRVPQASGRTLIILYTKPYTINGLDSETVSTMPAMFDSVLLNGAAWIACLIRAAGRIESINMNQNVPANFEKMAMHFRQAFELGMINLARRPFKNAQPVLKGWQDDWAGQW
jgi:hypothetical protein